MSQNFDNLRDKFPALSQKVNSRHLAYLDNAASTQRPQQVIEAIKKYYESDNANIHRAVHTLSQRGTLAFDDARTKVKDFINANSEKECIFVKGTTEAINLISTCFARQELKEGDEIILTRLEHHANIVPWQIACQQTGAKIKVADISPAGEIDINSIKSLISSKTKIISTCHVSNSLGTINPIKEIAILAKENNVVSVVDGAQAPAHLDIDVQDIGCDFYTVSSHKMYGPMGIGVLYGKEEWLDRLPPYQGGGDMIRTVSFEKSTYNDLPHKFEAGTPSVADVIGLASAINFINNIDRSSLHTYELSLHKQLEEELRQFDEIKIIGTSEHKAPITSFVIDGVHPHDIGTIADQHGVAIRTGHHCTMPLMDFFKVPATARASLSFYNNLEDIQQLIESINYALKLFKKR